MTITTYTAYFRQLAVSHHLLQHNPASETGDGPPSSKRFARFGADEVLTGLQSNVTFPALLIENYETKFAAAASEFVGEINFGAFSIFASANPQNTNEVEAAFALTQQIMQDCLQKLYADHSGEDHCALPLGNLDLNSIDITPVGMVFSKEFGYRCQFQFRDDSNNITLSPAPGTFL